MTAGGARPPGASFADQAFAAAAEAYAATPQGWERAVRSAIVALFEFLVDQPARTSACVAGEGGAGRDALARRDQLIDRFLTLLRPGFAAADRPPPPVVAEAIGGGIYDLVRSHVVERRLDRLAEAIPDATVVALSPFLGPAEALEVAHAGPRRRNGAAPLQRGPTPPNASPGAEPSEASGTRRA